MKGTRNESLSLLKSWVRDGHEFSAICRKGGMACKACVVKSLYQPQ